MIKLENKIDYLHEIKKNEKEFLQTKEKEIIDEAEENDNKKDNQDKENMLVPKTSLPIVLKNNLSKK